MYNHSTGWGYSMDLYLYLYGKQQRISQNAQPALLMSNIVLFCTKMISQQMYLSVWLPLDLRHNNYFSRHLSLVVRSSVGRFRYSALGIENNRKVRIFPNSNL